MMLRCTVARRAGFTLLVLVGCSLLWVATADAAWSAPSRVASSRVWSYSRPLLAINGSGAGALVWHREEQLNETLSGVEASTRFGAGWAPPVVLAPSMPSRSAYSPEVAMDARGRAIAVWGAISATQAAISPRPGVGFGRARTLPGRVSAPRPQVAVNARGNVTVVYQRLTAGLWVAVHGPGGSWRALPAITGTSRTGINEPAVASDGRGETLLAWVSGNKGERLKVQTVVLGANDKAERPPQTLFSTTNQNISELHLAVNQRGDAVLLWRQKAKDGPAVIEGATRRAGAGFGRVLTIAREKEADELSVALDERGFAVLLFTHILSTQPGAPEESSNSHPTVTQTAAVEVTTHSFGKRWSKPSELAPQKAGSTFEPQVSCDPAGEQVMAIWTNARFRSTEVSTYTGKIEMAAINPGGGWQPPTVLSPAGSLAPTLALSANGSATAAWVSESGETQSIDAVTYNPS